MGLISRQLSVDQAVSTKNALIDSGAEAGPRITDAQRTVLKKMGFSNGEQVEYFDSEIKSNPQLSTVFTKFENNFATSPKYDVLLRKVGSQVLKDGERVGFDTDITAKKGISVLDKLSQDLSNKSTADNFVKKLEANPDAIAASLDSYVAGGTTLMAMVAPAATPVAPVTAAKAPVVKPAATAVTPKREAVAVSPVASTATLPPIPPYPSVAVAPLEDNKKTAVEPAATAVTPIPKEEIAGSVVAPVDYEESSGDRYDRLFGTPDVEGQLSLNSADPVITTVKKLSPATAAVAPVVTVTSLEDYNNKPAAPVVTKAGQPASTPPVAAAAQVTHNSSAPLLADVTDKIVTSLATSTDDQIRGLSKGDIKIVAAAIATQATKMGVGSEYTKSFKDRMDRDPDLMKKFQENLQQNPEFVRQMAKTMKDGGEMPSSMKEIAKKTMQEVMEQPEKLADDGFVKRMSQGMSMKGGMDGLSSMFKGLGDMGGMFAGLGSFFQGIMDKIQSFIKEVSGGEWLSRRNSGRNFLQAFSDTLDQTPNRLASEANAKNSMVVHPMIVGGVPRWTHDESVRDDKGVSRMGSDGKELTSVRPNTFEITTISGSQIKVLPATGVPAVRDAQGNYHMNVVKEMDANNRPSDVQQVVLSVDQFRAYNAHLKQYGDPSMPPQYVMADNNVANIARVGANVTTVEPNGTLGQRVNTAEVAATNHAANKTQPPAPARTPADAANDPEYQLRIKS